MDKQFKYKLRPAKRRQTSKRHTGDTLVLLLSLVGPIASMPQAVQIYMTGTATGVSLITWALLTVYNASMAVYGASHKLLPIIVSNVIFVAVELLIVIGILIYA
jgi:uncharacterized protein with PQ loop repeat